MTQEKQPHKDEVTKEADHTGSGRASSPDDTLADKVARGELPGGQYMPPEEPPVLPEPIGDVIFEEPGAPPPNFLEEASNIIDEESL